MLFYRLFQRWHYLFNSNSSAGSAALAEVCVRLSDLLVCVMVLREISESCRRIQMKFSGDTEDGLTLKSGQYVNKE